MTTDGLEDVAANEWDLGDFEYRIERLAVYRGGLAVIAGEAVAASCSFWSTNVLIKVAGEWRAVASHVSGVRPRETSE